MFIAALFTMGKIWTQPVSIDRQMHKDLEHIYNGILLSHKNDKILPFATTWMDVEGIMPSKISQIEKDKGHMMSVICGILNKSVRNEQNKVKTNSFSCFDPVTLASILVFINTSHVLTSGPSHLLVSGILFAQILHG